MKCYIKNSNMQLNMHSFIMVVSEMVGSKCCIVVVRWVVSVFFVSIGI
jgi:hypothetical protein